MLTIHRILPLKRTAFGILLMTALLSGCRIVQIVDHGGRIVSNSGQHDCDRSCEIKVTGAFEDTFTAEPLPGFAFMGWKAGSGSLCGSDGSNTQPCAIKVSEKLLANLPADTKVTLQPIFRATAAGGHLIGVPSTISTTVEAEDLELEGYAVERNTTASGNAAISLAASPAGRGTASMEFDGDPGDYFIVVNYYDENDGTGAINLEIDGRLVNSWRLDQDRGHHRALERTYTAQTFEHYGIEPGSTITLKGVREGNENVVIDLIQFIPIYNDYPLARETEGQIISSPGRPGSIEGFNDFEGEGSIQWAYDTNSNPGDYILEFRYAYGAASDLIRPLDLYINDQLVKSQIPFPYTGHHHRWLSETAIVQLGRERNKIQLKSTGRSGPDIDYLGVTKIKYLNTTGSIAPSPSKDSAYSPEFGKPGYGFTYYGKVDPNGQRETLGKWLGVNGFINGGTDGPGFVEAAYINAHDLGFGRKMRCLNNGRSSCYVRNFLDPKGESRFAATVAMERMGVGAQSYVAFFVYDQNGKRINQIALDTEGAKSVPESCFACHGGSYDDDLGALPEGGHYLPFDVDAFENWPGRERLRDQMQAFQKLNQIVWNDAQKLAHNQPKKSIVDLIEGWYGGQPEGGKQFDSSRLPRDAWFEDPERVNGERYIRELFLYRSVYGRFCRTCHVAQNRDWQTGGLATASFFEVDVYDHICHLESKSPHLQPRIPIMPHAEVTYDKFGAGLPSSPDNKRGASAKEILCSTRLPTGGTTKPAPTTKIKAGRAVFFRDQNEDGCIACHYTDDAGNSILPEKRDLTCDGSLLVNDLADYSSQMVSIQLSKDDKTNLMSYFDSFQRCP